MNLAKPQNAMSAALQEPGSARLQSCQSAAIKYAAAAAQDIAAALRIMIATLREIFDEAAYARFLQRHQMPSSPHAYASFLREKESVANRRMRCC
jgi:hypothetical protein